MNLDFYHWGNMCPITTEMINLFRSYEDKVEVKLHDISNDSETCKEQNIFFPFLTVINKINRYYSPINRHLMEKILSGDTPKEVPYRPMLGTIVKNHDILPIKGGNYRFASKCTARENCQGCDAKVQIYQKIGQEIFGFMNIENETLLGGAEFYPSEFVPYNIPKGKDIAFITCVYLSHREYDYKSGPLERLEKYLTHQYNRLVVVSDEEGVFPNGNVSWFSNRGYIDEGVVFEDDYCKLHLMSKNL